MRISVAGKLIHVSDLTNDQLVNISNDPSRSGDAHAMAAEILRLRHLVADFVSDNNKQVDEIADLQAELQAERTRPRQPAEYDFSGITGIRVCLDWRSPDVFAGNRDGYDLEFSLVHEGKTLVVKEVKRPKPQCGAVSPVNDRLFCQVTEAEHVNHVVRVGDAQVTWPVKA
jgi:hypothetical protein